MAYKTILVHLNDARRALRLTEAAAVIARAFQSHLIGLHAFPAYRLTPPIPLPLGGQIASRIKAQFRTETEEIKAAFRRATEHQTFSADWRSVTNEHKEPAQTVLDHARATDLIVASQADPDWDRHGILDFPDRLAIESGRPALIVPNGAVVRDVPRRIIVGWKPCREAARAVFDALPLLKLAEDVYVLTFEARGSLPPGFPDTDIAAALARHGVKVNVSTTRLSDPSIGEELCMHALERGADLLVLGAYGRLRLSEFIFGGVTRHLLRDMTVPVLFSH